MPKEYKIETEKKYFEYLDDLRKRGTTNMYGAGVFLEEAFGLSRPEARSILTRWMRTFEKKG